MKDNKKIVMEQARFCKDLMDRLCLSVEKNLEKPNTYWSYSGICNCNQIGNDIVRLRRELSELNKMLNKGGEQG